MIEVLFGCICVVVLGEFVCNEVNEECEIVLWKCGVML